MSMLPDPTKAICSICGAHPKIHSGERDSDFWACECQGRYGGHSHVIYLGWNIPKGWWLGTWYAFRFYTVKLIRYILAV